MPMRRVNETVILIRKKGDKSERVVPEIGSNFNFTKEEIDSITGKRPQALSKALVEVEDEDEVAPATETETETETETKPKATGGKKAAAKDDEL